MKKDVIVISLGGSLIIPEDIDYKFLIRFKKAISKIKNKKIVVVCGGGSIARKYITAISKTTTDHKLISHAGINATRMNARFMSYFFGKDPEKGISHTKEEVKQNLKLNNIVFCGALRYAPTETSDGTAAKLARYLNSEFINITNVAGLYTADPKKNKKAKLISKISWKDFHKLANKTKFKPGQHFVLDQNAATIIMKNKIKTYIIGPNPKNLQRILKNKKFKGTTIEN
jgi:uridylate kinase